MKAWEMQTAKAKFSEVVKQAAEGAPQEMTLHGQPVAVLISSDLFEKLSGARNSLVDFMRRSPLAGLEEIQFLRDRCLPRKVRL